MSFGTIVKNAGSHRILHALYSGPKDSKYLKHIVGAINSIARFDGEYMHRLEVHGLVRKKNGLWFLTEEGRVKAHELGPTGAPRVNVVKHNNWKAGTYRPSDYQRPMRPGSEDFLALPSRMGDRLFYRDGTQKDIKDGN
jgi:hypothetical protein